MKKRARIQARYIDRQYSESKMIDGYYLIAEGNFKQIFPTREEAIAFADANNFELAYTKREDEMNEKIDGMTFEETYPEITEMKESAEDMRPYDYNSQKNVAEYAAKLQDMKDARQWILASNLYLAIERGDVPNNAHSRNEVWLHVREQMRRDDFAAVYWQQELQELEEQERQQEEETARKMKECEEASKQRALASFEPEEESTNYSNIISIDITIEIEKIDDPNSFNDGKYITRLRGLDGFVREFGFAADGLDEAMQNGAYLLNKESESLIDISGTYCP